MTSKIKSILSTIAVIVLVVLLFTFEEARNIAVGLFALAIVSGVVYAIYLGFLEIFNNKSNDDYDPY